MNEFTRIAMELADSYAESRESEATSKAEGDHGGWETALTQRRRSALLAHLEGGEQKWLPIETAPKDGSTVLLGYLSGNANIPNYSEEGYWMGDEERNHWGEVGWFATSDDVLCKHPSKPDVWMYLPLPATPNEAESK